MKEKKPSVLILGAGVSGISAAYHLNKAGIETKIIEGRNRPLGRVKTESKTFGYPVDHGAIWVDFTMPDNPFEKYMKEFKTHLVPVNPYHASGLTRDNKFISNIDNKISSIFKNFNNFLNEKSVEEEDSLKNYMKNFKQKNNLSKEDYDILSDISKVVFDSTPLAPIKKRSISNDINSFLSFNRETGYYMLPNGYSEFFSHFIKGLNIQYKTTITKVSQDKNKVTLHDSEGNIYISDYAVVTLPIGVLKRNLVDFEPDISVSKREVIREYKMDHLNKVIIEFEEKFWGDEFLIYLLDKHASYWMGINFNLVNGKNILIFIINSFYNYDLSSYSLNECKEFVLNKMKAGYPGKNVKIVKAVKTHWEEDPFTYGSFSSYFSKDKDYVKIFAEPEGRIYFAGEHTAVRNASTQGAWISGEERAKQIIELLKNKKK